METRNWPAFFTAPLAWVTLAAALLATCLWSRLTEVFISVDPFLFATSARRLLGGERLYLDFFESKPPLMTLIYAVPGLFSQGLERHLGGATVLLLVALFLQGAMWLRLFKPGLAAWSACLLFIVIYPTTYWDFAWASSEHFSNLCVTLILILSWKGFRDRTMSPRQMFLTGAATCIAFHFRQNCLLAGLIPLGVLLFGKQPWREQVGRIGWFVTGGLAVWAVILGTVLLVSDIPSYFFQVFVFPTKFAAHNGTPGMRSAAGMHMLLSAEESGLLYIAALAFGLALFHETRVFVFLSVAIGVSYCVVSPRAHFHYMVNLFPFVAMCILLAFDSGRGFRQRMNTLMLAFIVLLIGVRLATPLWKTRPKLAQLNEVVAEIDRQAAKGDTLQVIGLGMSEYVQLRSTPPPANKYPYAWEIDSNLEMMQDGTEAIFKSYLLHPPSLLVLDDATMKCLSPLPADRRKGESKMQWVLQLLYPNRSNASSELLQFVRLGRLLRESHPYAEVWNNGEFYIFRLQARP